MHQRPGQKPPGLPKGQLLSKIGALKTQESMPWSDKSDVIINLLLDYINDVDISLNLWAIGYKGFGPKIKDIINFARPGALPE